MAVVVPLLVPGEVGSSVAEDEADGGGAEADADEEASCDVSGSLRGIDSPGTGRLRLITSCSDSIDM